MNPIAVGIIGIVILIILLLLRMPVGFCLTAVGLCGFSYVVSPAAAGSKFALNAYFSSASTSFFVVPLFLFMGEIASNTGIISKLYDTAYAWLGRLPGGLAIAAEAVAHATRCAQ